MSERRASSPWGFFALGLALGAGAMAAARALTAGEGEASETARALAARAKAAAAEQWALLQGALEAGREAASAKRAELVVEPE